MRIIILLSITLIFLFISCKDSPTPTQINSDIYQIEYTFSTFITGIDFHVMFRVDTILCCGKGTQSGAFISIGKPMTQGIWNTLIQNINLTELYELDKYNNKDSSTVSDHSFYYFFVKCPNRIKSVKYVDSISNQMLYNFKNTIIEIVHEKIGDTIIGGQ
jgi:hypothetical protein